MPRKTASVPNSVPNLPQNSDEFTSHDQIFKELISTFFIEFLELFVP